MGWVCPSALWTSDLRQKCRWAFPFKDNTDDALISSLDDRGVNRLQSQNRMIFLFLVLSFFTFGCAGRKPVTYLSPDFPAKAPMKVAVLPFDNQSVDLLAPVEIQKLVTNGLQRRGYVPIPAESVQQKLQDIGITDGGQLRSVTAQKLGQTLQVDGLFYGTIEDFVFQDLGFFIRRAVRVRLKFVVASTGETLWEDFGQSKHIFVTTKQDVAEQAFIAGLASKMIGNMANRPLALESQLAVQNLILKLPGPGQGVIFVPGPPPGPPPTFPLPPPR